MFSLCVSILFIYGHIYSVYRIDTIYGGLSMVGGILFPNISGRITYLSDHLLPS
jgi:hypothetical protein